MQASRLSTVVCLVVASAIWGTITVLNKALLSTAPPIPLLAVQLAASTAALLAFVRVQNRPLPSWGAAAPILLLGVLNPGVSYALALVALVSISASKSALLWAAEPLLIVTIAAIVLKEPVTKRLMAVIVSGLAGVVLVTGAVAGTETTSDDVIGTLVMLLAVSCCAIYTVLSRWLVQSADPVSTVALQQAAGLASALLLMIFPGSFGSFADLVALPWNILAVAAVSGIFYYALAYALFLSALKVTPAGIASGYYNLIPVFGVGLAYAFLGETLSFFQVMGAITIITSATILARITAEVPGQ